MFSGLYSKPSSRKERAKGSAAKISVATPTVAPDLLNSCLRLAVTDSPSVHQFGQASIAGLWHFTCQLGLQHFVFNPWRVGVKPCNLAIPTMSHPRFCTKWVTNKASLCGALVRGFSTSIRTILPCSSALPSGFGSRSRRSVWGTPIWYTNRTIMTKVNKSIKSILSGLLCFQI